jgi:hypothetical protein
LHISPIKLIHLGILHKILKYSRKNKTTRRVFCNIEDIRFLI